MNQNRFDVRMVRKRNSLKIGGLGRVAGLRMTLTPSPSPRRRGEPDEFSSLSLAPRERERG
jgi:hypothetical protein